MNKDYNITFEDVLDDIRLEESEPSHESLKKWIAQYPEHREALARFFATWSVQKEQPSRFEIDEARIGNRMVSNALDLMRSVGLEV